MPLPQLANKTKSPQSWKRSRGVFKKRPGFSSHNRQVGHGQSGPVRRSFSKGGLSKAKLLKYGWYLFLFLLVFGLIATLIMSRGLPSPSKLIERQIAQSTKIYDREGKTVLYDIHGEEQRTLISLSDIPEDVKNSTIAIEDKNFYQHKGFSFWAIARTAITNVIFHKKAGGSTLTQQFVKNAVLTSEKKYSRKIKELILAYRIEKKFTKDEILQMYLNEIPYGSSAYGIEAAARLYFGKAAKDLNLAESAALAALPQAPTFYSPYGQNKEALLDRQRYVLDLMEEQGYISEAEKTVAKNTPLDFKTRIDNILAPHFVMYIRELLAAKYGEKAVEQGGYKIITTLDLAKQEMAEKAIAEIAPKNLTDWQASNAALISLDPKTGQVLVMVGSKDFFDEDIDGQVNVTLRPRQPGSSFKPIVYTAAWLKGYLPETKVFDVVTNFSDDPQKSYTPHNYTGQEYGPVSFRQALAGSLNITAVKALYLTGVGNVLKLAEDLGYSTLRQTDTDRLGLSLVLGGGEVTLLDHTSAFGALAREGELQTPVFILKIEDKDGKTLEEWQPTEPKKVIPANIVRLTNSILSDNSARAFIFGANNYLTLPNRPAAAKTGTTNDYRDAWTIGYTPSLVTGVWVGNNNNKEMRAGADGSKIAAPIWQKYMREALGSTPVEYFNQPTAEEVCPILRGEGLGEKKIKLDQASGLLATELTPPSQIIEKTYIQTHDILHYLDKNDPRNCYPKNPQADPQYSRWEAGVQQWVLKKQKDDPNFIVTEPPTESDNVHLESNLPTFTTALQNNQVVTSASLNINLLGSAPRGLSKTEYYINSNLFAVNANSPFGLNRSLAILPNGVYRLTVKLCDDIDNCSSQDFTINLQLANNNQALPASLAWATPANGLQIAPANFPLSLKVNIINPDALAVVSFYLIKNNEPQLLGAVVDIDENVENFSWLLDPNLPSGSYQLYAVGKTWNEQQTETAKITLQFKK